MFYVSSYILHVTFKVLHIILSYILHVTFKALRVKFHLSFISEFLHDISLHKSLHLICSFWIIHGDQSLWFLCITKLWFIYHHHVSNYLTSDYLKMFYIFTWTCEKNDNYYNQYYHKYHQYHHKYHLYHKCHQYHQRFNHYHQKCHQYHQKCLMSIITSVISNIISIIDIIKANISLTLTLTSVILSTLNMLQLPGPVHWLMVLWPALLLAQ